MKVFLSSLHFLIIIVSSQANLWDNLFFEQNMELHIPEEFTITLQADSATLGKLELIAEVSTTKKRMRISQYIQY
jgi:hypothetical protein